MTALDRFRETFAGFEQYYTIIGGTACQILLDELGGSFRATSDLDIVVLIDAPDFDKFGRVFWNFIEEGGYAAGRGKKGRACFYRFIEPKTPGYPKKIELSSRKPMGILSKFDQHAAPLSLSESLASLSAIILDDEYYRLLKQGRTTIDGVSVLEIEYLILFKMKARIDLMVRCNEGEHVDSRDLKKHQRDVFRLWRYADAQKRIPVSQSIQKDIDIFFDFLDLSPQQLVTLEIDEPLDEVVRELRKMYVPVD